MGGVRFHTIDCDSQCTTQNSGVMVVGESNTSGGDDNNFYGVLEEVLCNISDGLPCLAIEV